ncbi:DUF805 domain-containing protein [Marinifilum fragile]|uniref:DUF805 domain-containing protein n=1 Tax=Marinifilum fragile TaxID=570161 RepID=UPI002AA80D4A|nr:DUF805 domain-containing protein [Marinifilum fragile]
MNWYLKVLQQYAIFSGRAGRKEFWMFVLFNLVISIAASVIDSVMGTWGIIGGIYVLLVLIPALAVSARRLHDIGKSGWMLLVGFIPIIGAIWLIVLWASEGQPGSNQYGQQVVE